MIDPHLVLAHFVEPLSASPMRDWSFLNWMRGGVVITAVIILVGATFGLVGFLIHCVHLGFADVLAKHTASVSTTAPAESWSLVADSDSIASQETVTPESIPETLKVSGRKLRPRGNKNGSASTASSSSSFASLNDVSLSGMKRDVERHDAQLTDLYESLWAIKAQNELFEDRVTLLEKRRK